MKQQLFEVFGGEGYNGRKADDLAAHAELLESMGIRIPRGFIITSAVFDHIISEPQEPRQTLSGPCPLFLERINQALLRRMQQGTHYAIRSSAPSESGGIGIHETTFFFVTGDESIDMERLWRCEAKVYASELTEDAAQWREKQKAPMGMSILIQGVTGETLVDDDWFLPALSGTAYTSYNGLLTVRCVIGLGTRAVKGEGIILHEAPDHVLHFQRSLWDQKQIDVLTPNGIETQNSHYGEIQGGIHDAFETFCKFFKQLEELRKTHSLYLEWAISGSTIDILQCSERKDSLPGNSSLDPNEYFHLMTGSDVFNSGEMHCKHIVFAGFWSKKVSDAITFLNRGMKDYLLIVVQDATSDLAGENKLAFRHLSNAVAVAEMQWSYTDQQRENLSAIHTYVADHVNGRKGATHFAGICEKSNILYVGGNIPVEKLWMLRGAIQPRDGSGDTVEDIHIWNLDAVVTTNAIEGVGSIYISKKLRSNEYAPHQVLSWCGDLRTAANRILEHGNQTLANHFYLVHYAIAPGDPEHPSIDPFALEQDIVTQDGIPKIIESINEILQCGHLHIEHLIWQGGLEGYLRDLAAHVNTLQ